jgi:molybdopterin synthase catalytic subunit
MRRWITDQPLDLNSLIAETADNSCGALITFVGTVRNNNEDRPVCAMTYEAHVSLAEKMLRELEDEVLSRFDVLQCRIQHRIGTLQLGEASVIIVVRASHRAPAYQASQYAIDELKQRAAIWMASR